MLNLTSNLLFAQGSERNCYIHPLEPSKIIKLVFNQKEKSSNQNNVEYKYYQYLEKKGIDFSHLSKCHGWIDTNLGKGLVFEKIVNYDGSNAKSLRFYIQNKLLKKEQEEQLLDELKHYLIKNTILFADATSVNVICQKIETNKYKLVIIDGLGTRREGFKFNLYLKISMYKKYKILKQWNLFLNNLEKVRMKYL